MRPALPTVASKLGFVVGTALLLTLPRVLGQRQDSSYLLAIPSKWGPVGHVYRATSVGEAPLDVLLLGSSLLEADIDAPYLRESLGRALERPARVEATLTLGWSLVPAYEYLKETLQHRPVKLAVIAHFGSELGLDRGHEAITPFLWNDSEDGAIFEREPLDFRAGFYAFAVLGAPRTLLGRVRPNARLGWTEEQRKEARSRSRSLGVFLREDGFSDTIDGAPPHGPYNPFEPPRPPDVDPQTTFYYGPGTNGLFTETAHPEPPTLDLLRAIVELAHAHGTRVVYLDVPGLTRPTQVRETTVHVASVPRDLYAKGFAWIGIPGWTLFHALEPDEVHQLFTDWRHMNRNGARYYTRLVAPALVSATLGTDHR